MFSHLKLSTRLIIMVVITLVGMLIIAVFGAISARNALLESYKQEIRHAVQIPYNIMAYYQAQESAGKLSRDEAQRLAKEAVKNARFSGEDKKSNYFYVYSLEGVGVLPPKEEWVGQNLLGKILGKSCWFKLIDHRHKKFLV